MRTKLLLLLTLSLCSSGLWAEPYKSGETPFDDVGKTLEGEEIKVSDYKGKVVIVSFWASWCEPCRKELPVLVGIQKSATPEKLQVISINIDEERQLFKKLVGIVANTEIKMVHDGKRKTSKKYGVDGIPHMVIIDEEGKVASVHVGYGESQLPALVDEINEIASRH